MSRSEMCGKHAISRSAGATALSWEDENRRSNQSSESRFAWVSAIISLVSNWLFSSAHSKTQFSRTDCSDDDIVSLASPRQSTQRKDSERKVPLRIQMGVMALSSSFFCFLLCLSLVGFLIVVCLSLKTKTTRESRHNWKIVSDRETNEAKAKDEEAS